MNRDFFTEFADAALDAGVCFNSANHKSLEGKRVCVLITSPGDLFAEAMPEAVFELVQFAIKFAQDQDPEKLHALSAYCLLDRMAPREWIESDGYLMWDHYGGGVTVREWLWENGYAVPQPYNLI